MTDELALDYASPRWSQEILDCSMPMSLDTYSRCSGDCLYCFSYFQKSHCCQGYVSGEVRACNPGHLINQFENTLKGNYRAMAKADKQFIPYIRARRMMQWGALADQFDAYEKHHGITLRLLKYFDKIDYPLSFSTKFSWVTKDARYMNLFAKHAHNWHFKVSIITLDEKKARKVERGIPSPALRLKAIERLAELGLSVTLRLRPIIPGISEDWPDLLTQAAEVGANSVSTEFFCLEARADADLRARYDGISEACGFDIYQYYRKHSRQNGYKRLNESIKRPILTTMRDKAHELGLRFYVSDAIGRDLSDGVNCCGVPAGWPWSCKAHFGGAIRLAQQNGQVRFCEIQDDSSRLFRYFKWNRAQEYNTASGKKRAKYRYLTMADWFRLNWNMQKLGTSPGRMYGSCLKAAGKDENNDVIYTFNPNLIS